MTRPNVVLVTIDCLRYDRCGFNDHDRETTPTLDRLAHEATIFDTAVAPGPRTSESVPGILAGLLSADCAFYDEIPFKAIPSDAPTIATWLRDHGYRTVASISNPQLSPVRNFDRGFDEFSNLRIEHEGDRFEEERESNDASGGVGARISSLRGRLRDPIRNRIRENGPRPFDPASIAFLVERFARKRSGWPTVPGADVIDGLLSAIDEAPADRPAFAWTHLNDLHAPLHPGRVREGGLLDSPSDLTQFRWDLRRVADRYEPNYVAMYESTLRYVDAQIDRLVEHLQERGMWDETVLIVTADHGEALHDRGVYGHAAGDDRFVYDPSRDYMYEELLHVPLLVREPNGEGQRVRTPFSLVWLHELIAEITGVERGAFPRESGREGHRDPSSDALVIADAISTDGHTIGTREGRLKRVSECAGGERGSLDGDPLVFDLDIDPGERTDLSATTSAQQLADAAEEVFTPPGGLRPLAGKIDSDTRELLGQLGYQ
ncbi:sulfatase [Salinigranum sp. GCM10025319]|uniref:sulfatase n=1 Tax=Salinigranum sp. GCM10025319 TaxID=3252687 RepID=UPI00360DB7C8